MSTSGGKNLPGAMPESRTPTPTPSQPRPTRQSAQSARLPKAEIINQPYDVKDAKGGAAFLEKSLLTLVGVPLTTERLATVLLHITQMPRIPRPAIEAMRAVAFLLEENTMIQTASSVTKYISTDYPNEIAAKVVAAISPHIATFHKSNESLKSNVDYLQTLQLNATDTLASNSIISSVEKVASTADEVNVQLTDIKEVVTQLAPTLASTQESIKSLLHDLASHSPPTTTPHPLSPQRSYSDVVRSQPSTTSNNLLSGPAMAALARAATKGRQILLDPAKGQSLHSPDTSNADIARKYKDLLQEVSDEDAPTLEIKAVIRLKNGGLILEFDSAESVAWLHKENNKACFLGKLGTPVGLKERSYPIVVPFLPVGSPLEDPSWLRAIEAENNLQPDSISSARWIKLKAKRAPNQSVAHAIFTFQDPNPANALIRDGLYVSKEKLHPRKEKKDPIRCAKCQGWGHIARDCSAIHDTCAICGHAHRTDSCNDNSKKKFCVNCKTSSHGSNDTKCPIYLTKCAELDAKLPENSMPYYPTNEPWTQIMIPMKLPPPSSSPQPSVTQRSRPSRQPNHQTLRQTTLDPSLARHTRNTQRSRTPPAGPNRSNLTNSTEANAVPLGPPQRQHQTYEPAAQHLQDGLPTTALTGWDY